VSIKEKRGIREDNEGEKMRSVGPRGNINVSGGGSRGKRRDNGVTKGGKNGKKGEKERKRQSLVGEGFWARQRR